MTESYLNGYRFGLAYARNYGTQALLSHIRNSDSVRFHDRLTLHSYFGGVIDAALAVVQGVK